MSVAQNNYNFLSMVSSIPVVNYTLHIGSNIYSNVKKCNPYVEQTFLATEYIVVYIANSQSVNKLTKKLEKPLVAIDSFVCDGLQKLEHKYPAICLAPQQIKEEAVNQAVVLRGMGAKKLEELMQSICRQRKARMDRAWLLLEDIISDKISVYVDYVEKSVNDYLPPLEDTTEYPMISSYESNRLFNRLSVLPYRIQERVAQRCNHFVFRITWKQY